MTPKILSVLINWRRPLNITPILQAYREQTVPSYIALVECAPRTEFEAPPEARSLADIVFSVSENLGPCSRFIPPLAIANYEYTFFGVDDHIPGPRHLEHLLASASRHGNRFASIGQDGRCVVDGELRKNRIRVGDDGEDLCADVIVSSELVQTKHIPYIINFRQRMIDVFRFDVPEFEDDLFLGCGIQLATGFPSIVTSIPSKEESWKKRQLHAPNALCARPEHYEVRQRFLDMATKIGWGPVRNAFG